MDLEETEDAHSGFGGRWTKIDDDCMVEKMGRSSRRMEVRYYRLDWRWRCRTAAVGRHRLPMPGR